MRDGPSLYPPSAQKIQKWSMFLVRRLWVWVLFIFVGSMELEYWAISYMYQVNFLYLSEVWNWNMGALVKCIRSIYFYFYYSNTCGMFTILSVMNMIGARLVCTFGNALVIQWQSSHSIQNMPWPVILVTKLFVIDLVGLVLYSKALIQAIED